MPSELPRLETIFNDAMEIAAPQERAAFLDRACGEDADLRQRVEALLKAHDNTGDVLRLPYSQRKLEAFPVVSEGPGTMVGRYRLLEQIGEGGFGVVFMAEQQQPVRRKVALKLLKPGMDSRQVLARFEAERQALALMDHPNIAKVLDAGATDAGRPYFVMELVKGVPITEFCDQHQLTARQRLELFATLCHAVQHAHTKGIIHRDIKPTNVLVMMHDTTPMVKVIDFGVAKALGQELTEKTLFTGFAQHVGTPLYMSPEQAGQSALDADTRSDIYSLGVLLYELLTGSTPFNKERFRQAAQEEIRRIIREEEPPKPSTRLSESKDSLASICAQRHTEPAKLTRLVRGELDWIVMKALEKDRGRRYETANGFARDVERYLSNEAVEACPPSAAYRFSKFVRRNHRALATAAIVIATLLAGTVVSTWQAVRATRAIHAERQMRQQASESEAAAKESERVAVANTKIAQAQSGRANLYFLNARAVVDGQVARINDSRLLHLPEVAALRKSLLEDLLNCYQMVFQNEGVDVPGLSDKASTLRMIGDIRLMLGDAELAEKAYRNAIALREPDVAQHPEQFESFHVLATSHAKLGDLLAGNDRAAEAEADYRRAIVLWSPLATDRASYSGTTDYLASLRTYHRVLFNLLEHRGQREAARAICGELLAPFEESAAKAPGQMDAQIRLADALYWGGLLLADTGRLEEGHKLGDRALDLYAELPRTLALGQQKEKLAFRYLHKARLLDERKRWTEAGNAYRIAAEFIPKAAYAQVDLAWRVVKDAKFRDPSLVIDLTKNALELNPKNYLLHHLGEAYYRAGDWKAAIAAFEKSIGLFRGDSFDDFPLAMANWRLGEREAARKWYNQAVEGMQNYEPNDAELIRLHSEAAELLGGPATLRKGLQLNPKDVNARLNLAYALWGEGKLDEATDEFREAVRLDLGNADARRDLAWALNSQAWALVIDSDPEKRDNRRAVKLAQEAVELAPKDAHFWNTLGVAQYREGNWKDAVSSLQKYRQLHAGDFEGGVPFFLAMAHWRLGNQDGARTWYDKGAESMADGTRDDFTGETLIRFRDEAAELLGVNQKK